MLSNEEKMRRQMWYDANFDQGLAQKRNACKDELFRYNCQVRPSDVAEQQKILHKVLGRIGQNVTMLAPLYCDYGYNVSVGDDVFMNHNTLLMDCAPITFGSKVFIGPNCSFYTAEHPLHAGPRNAGYEKALPITVGSNVWFGGSVTVLGGVTIGDGCVIGAGSLVTKSMPAGYLCYGVPCEPVKKIADLPEEQVEYPDVQAEKQA